MFHVTGGGKKERFETKFSGAFKMPQLHTNTYRHFKLLRDGQRHISQSQAKKAIHEAALSFSYFT